MRCLEVKERSYFLRGLKGELISCLILRNKKERVGCDMADEGMRNEIIRLKKYSHKERGRPIYFLDGAVGKGLCFLRGNVFF
jgi:hypothetical protein